MNDRRLEDRRCVNLAANLKLMNVINGPAEITEVSPSGLRLTSRFLFSRMNMEELGDLIGHSLRLSIPSENLNVEGHLLRVDPDYLCMKVHSTTNAVLWHNLCDNQMTN